MLKTRLVAVLLLHNGQVVQSVQFKLTNVIHSNPVTAVDCFDRWAADEIVVLDVSRDQSMRPLFYEAVANLSRKCFVPLSVGGWVGTVDEVRKLLRLGADKVIINQAATDHPALITECARIFGTQCIVVSIDAKPHDGGYVVCTDHGRHETSTPVVVWAKEAEARGAGELFLNCIDRDGARQGYDLALLASVVDAVRIPVIAMGGVFTWQHLVDGAQAGASAVAAANIFHYTEQSMKKAKQFMAQAGVDVRGAVAGSTRAPATALAAGRAA